MAKLFITLADSGQMTHQLAGAVITIGRYPDNMIQINHASVSGHHARLVSRGGRYRLEDLNSSPRSFLNGMPTAGADLPDSCVLRFGTVECVFKDEVAASPIDQYVTRLADSQRQVDTVIRARDFLHQQVQDIQKKMEDAERTSDERASELDDLRKLVSALTKAKPAPAPNGNNEPAPRMEPAGSPDSREMSSDFENRLDASKQAAAQLAEQLADARAQVERVTAELQAALQSQAGASKTLETALHERDTASSRLAGAAEKMAELTKERDALQQGAEALSKALSHAKQQIDAVSGDRDTLRREREELAAAAAAERRKREELLDQQQKAHEERLAAAEEKVESSARERADQAELSGALQDAGQQEHAQWTASLEARQQEVAFLEGQRKTLTEELEQASARLAEAAQQNETLLRERDTVERGHEGLSEALKELNQQIETLSGERDALQARHEQTSAHLEEQLQRIASLEHERNEQHQAAAQFSQQLAEVREEAGMHAKAREEAQEAAQQNAIRLEDLRRELDAATMERDAEREVRQELVAKLEHQQIETAALAEQCEAGRAKIEALGQEMEGLAAQLEKSRAGLGSAAEQGNAFQQQNEALAASLAEAREKVESLARSRGANRQEIEAMRADRDSLKQLQAEGASHLEQMTRQLAAVTDERNRHRAANERSAAAIAETEDRLKAMTRERDATIKCAHELAESHKHAEELSLERDTLQKSCQELTAKLKEQKPPDNAKALEQFRIVLTRKEEEIARLKEELNAARARKPSPAEFSLVTHVQPAEVEAHPAHGVERETAPAFEVGTGMRSVPSLLSATRNRLHYFIRHPGDETIMGELSHHIREIKEMTGAANLETSQRLANVLNGMMEDIVKRPEHVTPGLLRTLSQSVDFLITLQEPKVASRANVLSRGTIFVVDDDPGILDAIVPSLEEACLQVSCAEQARKALKILGDQKFDLVLLDVGLPEMNGMDLCAKIRGIAHQRKTPIVFLTGMDTVQNRVQSMLSGGNDFIGKPFNTWELAAKSLIWVLKSQLSLI